MKSKKLILLIVTVLLLSLTTPAFAASKPNTSTKVTSKLSLPDVKIEVVVPSGKKAYLNPQKLPVKIGSKVNYSYIFTDEAHIENKSNVAVNVSASVTGAVKSGSNMSIVTDAFDTKNETAKKAFFYFQMQAIDDPDNVDWSDDYDPEQDIIVSKSAKSKNNIVTLAAYRTDENGTPEDSVRYGAFRLSGLCTEDPKTAWTSKDGVDVNIVFTFTALPYNATIE